MKWEKEGKITGWTEDKIHVHESNISTWLPCPLVGESVFLEGKGSPALFLCLQQQLLLAIPRLLLVPPGLSHSLHLQSTLPAGGRETGKGGYSSQDCQGLTSFTSS